MSDDRLDRLTAEVSARTEKRDDEIKSILQDIATHDHNFVSVETRLKAIEEQKPPNFLAFVGAGVGIAGLLAAGFSFVIDTQAEIQAAIHGAITQRMDGQDNILDGHKETMRAFATRQEDARQRIAHIEGELPEVKERLRDVDRDGSRVLAKRSRP